MTKRLSFYASEQVEICGQTYTLVFDINAMADLESINGGNAFDTIDRAIQGDINAATLRALLWAQMQENHKDLSLRQVGTIVSKDFYSALAAVQSAIKKCMPKAEDAADAEESPENPPKVQTAA